MTNNNMNLQLVMVMVTKVLRSLMEVACDAADDDDDDDDDYLC